MKPGQRINLIRKLAQALSKFQYSDGDLILRQFGLPWTDQWSGSGNSADYYLEMVERGEDKSLLELYEYLYPDEPLPTGAAPSGGGGWSNGTLRLFISHSSKQKLFVTQLKQELSEFGIEAFIAHEDIKPSKEWLREIRRALDTCHAFTAILCKNFQTSDYCDHEVGCALQRRLLVIPVRLEIDPYGFMNPIQGIPAFDKSPNEVAQKVKELLLLHPTTAAIMSSIEKDTVVRLAKNFIVSSNFQTSTTLLRRLEKYEHLPKAVLDLIAQNWEKNDQITGCMGIPSRMKALFRKHNMKKLADSLNAK